MAVGAISNYQGYQIETVENGHQRLVKVYNDTGAAVANGKIYHLAFAVDATDPANPIFRPYLLAPATQATESNLVVVVDNSYAGKASIANLEYGYACISGVVKAFCDGTSADIAVGDQLEVLNTGTAFIVAAAATAGKSGALVPESAAIALEAHTPNAEALKSVLLIGRQCQIKAT